MTANQINYATLQENKRHNLATEAELNRHQVATESAQIEMNEINRQHYERQDAINALHYSTMDAETARHNLAQESLSAQQIDVSLRQLAESQRHNLTQESIQQTQVAETKRSNLAQEALKAGQIAIDRINAEVNVVNAQTRQAELEEQTRHSKQTEANEAKKISETTRHNKEQELIESQRNVETQRHNKVEESVDVLVGDSQASLNYRKRDQAIADTLLTELKYEQEKVNLDYLSDIHEADLAKKKAEALKMKAEQQFVEKQAKYLPLNAATNLGRIVPQLLIPVIK